MSDTNQAAPAAEAPVVEETTEAVETTEAAPAQPQSAQQAAKEEQKKFFKKLKLKIDGEETEEELPFEIPDTEEAREYMKRQLQFAKVSQKRAKEYSTLSKEVQDLVAQLQKDPKSVLKNPALGVDIKKLVTEYLEEEIANSQKSPEQIEKERLEQELKAIKEEREKEKKEFEERELERLTNLEFQRYDEMVEKALDKNKDLPRSPYVVKKVAEYLLLGLQNDLDISAEDVIPLVRQEIQNDIKEMFGAMPDEVMEKFLGKDRLTKMRKKNIQNVKTAPQPISKTIQDVGKAQKPADKGDKKLTYKQFFKV